MTATDWLHSFRDPPRSYGVGITAAIVFLAVCVDVGLGVLTGYVPMLRELLPIAALITPITGVTAAALGGVLGGGYVGRAGALELEAGAKAGAVVGSLGNAASGTLGVLLSLFAVPVTMLLGAPGTPPGSVSVPVLLVQSLSVLGFGFVGILSGSVVAGLGGGVGGAIGASLGK